MADWDKIKFKLHDSLGDNPQRLALGQIHLEAVQGALIGLNSLGFNYDLIEDPTSPPVEFPKMLYKDTPGSYEPVSSIVVHSQGDEEKLVKDGWRLTPLAVVKVVESKPAPPAKAPEPAKGAA